MRVSSNSHAEKKNHIHHQRSPLHFLLLVSSFFHTFTRQNACIGSRLLKQPPKSHFKTLLNHCGFWWGEHQTARGPWWRVATSRRTLQTGPPFRGLPRCHLSCAWRSAKHALETRTEDCHVLVNIIANIGIEDSDVRTVRREVEAPKKNPFAAQSLGEWLHGQSGRQSTVVLCVGGLRAAPIASEEVGMGDMSTAPNFVSAWDVQRKAGTHGTLSRKCCGAREGLLNTEHAFVFELRWNSGCQCFVHDKCTHPKAPTNSLSVTEEKRDGWRAGRRQSPQPPFKARMCLPCVFSTRTGVSQNGPGSPRALLCGIRPSPALTRHPKCAGRLGEQSQIEMLGSPADGGPGEGGPAEVPQREVRTPTQGTRKMSRRGANTHTTHRTHRTHRTHTHTKHEMLARNGTGLSRPVQSTPGLA